MIIADLRSETPRMQRSQKFCCSPGPASLIRTVGRSGYETTYTCIPKFLSVCTNRAILIIGYDLLACKIENLKTITFVHNIRR